MSLAHSKLAELCRDSYSIDEINRGKDFAFCAEVEDTLIVVLKGSTVGEEGYFNNRQWYENAQMLAPDIYNGAATVLNYFGYKLPVLTGTSYNEVKDSYNSSNKASARGLAEEIEPFLPTATKVLVTGHSRGGMLAIQCAIELHNRHPQLNISVVTFAAPIMTMTQEEISYLSDKVTCYKHNQDPVVALDAGGGSLSAQFKTIVLYNSIPVSDDGSTDWFGGHRIEIYIEGVKALEFVESAKKSIKAVAKHGKKLFDLFQKCK